MTKKLPAPFKRPSIDIGGSAPEPREWKTVKLVDIRIGDTVADHGKCTEMEQTGEAVHHRFFDKEWRRTAHDSEKTVFAFVRKTA